MTNISTFNHYLNPNWELSFIHTCCEQSLKLPRFQTEDNSELFYLICKTPAHVLVVIPSLSPFLRQFREDSPSIRRDMAELRSYINDCETQIHHQKPLIQLVDNMVKSSSGYGGRREVSNSRTVSPEHRLVCECVNLPSVSWWEEDLI